MQRWRSTLATRVLTRQPPSQPCQPYRQFSSQHHVQTIAVPCASAGSIDVNLHNISQHSRSHPLVIYIPPFFQTSTSSPPPLPAFLRSYPSAVINYRWLDPSSDERPTSRDKAAAPSNPQWPTPIHDTLFGYSWIIKNLASPGSEKRDVYVYGSYLGASIATSLALTESHQDRRMAVRGLLTYNGIYNWTMFLPDHPIHQRKSALDTDDTSYVEGSFFHYLRDKMPVLFPSPSQLFDPFASPSLFFRDPGLWVPDDFTSSIAGSAMSRAIDELSGSSPSSGEGSSASSTSTTWNLKPPPKSYLTFPPWASTLKIPESLLLYESPPPKSRSPRQRKAKTAPKTVKKRKILNNFEGQATELSNLMRRSVEKYELGDRENGNEDAETMEEPEWLRRVQTRDVGAVEGDGQLGGMGQNVAEAWLRERIE